VILTGGLICEFVTIPLIFCCEIPVVSLRKLCNCYELPVNNGYDHPVNFVTIPLFSRVSLFLALRKPCFFWKNKLVTWRVATFSKGVSILYIIILLYSQLLIILNKIRHEERRWMKLFPGPKYINTSFYQVRDLRNFPTFWLRWITQLGVYRARSSRSWWVSIRVNVDLCHFKKNLTKTETESLGLGTFLHRIIYFEGTCL